MKLVVLSREKIEFEPPPRAPYAVVSMHGGGDPPTKVVPGTQCKGILFMEFNDVEDPRVRGSITNAQAREIWKFVKGVWSEIKILVCQCNRGISRSSAVAAAASKIYLGTDEYFFNHPKYDPNVLVHSRILKAAVEDGMEF